MIRLAPPFRRVSPGCGTSPWRLWAKSVLAPVIAALAALSIEAAEPAAGRAPPARHALATGGEQGGAAPAAAVAPMAVGPKRPAALLLDPPAGYGPPPDDADLEPIRAIFRDECRDLLRVARSHLGARMVAGVLEEAAAVEKDAVLRWVLLEETLRLSVASGEPKRIASAVALATEHYRFDALQTELDALSDIPQRVLRPERIREIATAAERLAAAATAADRPHERRAAWKLAADSWRRTGDRGRTESALAEYRRAVAAVEAD